MEARTLQGQDYRAVLPVSAAVREAMDAEAAEFAAAVAELEVRALGSVAQFAERGECPGCSEPVDGCTCLHRICY
jgi:hypothetical protein